MSIRVKVIKPGDAGDDEWGNVLDLFYSAADETLTIRHHDGSSVRRKVYFCGHYVTFRMDSGPTAYDLFPADAERE